MADLINEYRNLLWASVLIIVLGSYAFTTLALVYLQKGLNDNILAIQMVAQDARLIREKQIAVVGEANFIHKTLIDQMTEIRERVQRGK